MSTNTAEKNNKTKEEEEIEEEEKEEVKENHEEEEIEKEKDKENETPKKKKKKVKKNKKEKKEELENSEEKPKEEEIKNEEENKSEEKPKKTKKKKKKKKKSETEEKEEKEGNENIKENNNIKEENNIENNNINNDIKEEKNNIEEEDNKENKEDNNITEDKKVEEKEEPKTEKKEESKIETKEERKEEIKDQDEEEEIQEKKINTKKQSKKIKEKEKEKEKKSKKNQINKSKKSTKKSKKQIIEEEEEQEQEEEENEAEEQEEQPEEEIEEQETSPTERKKSKKTKEKKSKSKANPKLHINPKFEKELNAAYKILLKISKNDDEDFEEDENEEEESDEENPKSHMNSDMENCEKKLRSALKICENDHDMIINRNIIDKLSRIAEHKKINLNYILGNIYISLMSREFLFDYEDEENFEVNDLLLFINKVIHFREEMKNNKINISYDESLKNFLFFVTEQFDLEQAQLKSINKILDEETDIDHSNITTKKNFNNFINSLNAELESQPNLYEQYEIFIQNKKDIINLIQESDPEERSEYNNYLKLGKCLAYMFFNQSVNMFVQKNLEIEKEDEDDDLGEMLLFYNGEENQGEINIVNGEKFCIAIDDKIKELRKKLGEIIIKYCEQFIDIIDIFPIQYIIFILLSRLYSCKYKKYNDEINPIFAESIINMFFFKNSPLDLLAKFVDNIVTSENIENDDLKKLLLIKIKEVKDEEEFLYQLPEEVEKKYKDKKIKYEPKKSSKKKPKAKSKKKKVQEEEEEEEESEDETEEEDKNPGAKFEDIISEENLFLLHNDLKLGYFNKKVIKSGEKFIFYEEINSEYSLLDFCVDLTDLDIKFSITDMTEGREIYNKERLISNVETPLKIIMFFTNPRVLKFEFDNSYSWVRSKTIKYKTNIFYPKYPYLISHHISLGKYISSIAKTKRDLLKKKYKGKKKVFSDDTDKLLLFKMNGKNRAFNCLNLKDNIDAINHLVKNKYLFYLSLFIKIKDENNEQEKSIFYYYSREKKEFLENELTQENFENILNKALPNENASLNVINIYIINDNINNNINYSKCPIRKLLGFEPISNGNNSISKILYFIQPISQAKLLYCLYSQINTNQLVDVIIFLNYNKSSGYQITIFDTDEILENNENFKGIKSEANFEADVNIISEGIKKMELGEERKLLVVCNKVENLGEKLKENLKEIKNISVVEVEEGFNKEVEMYSHIFYLEN